MSLHLGQLQAGNVREQVPVSRQVSLKVELGQEKDKYHQVLETRWEGLGIYLRAWGTKGEGLRHSDGTLSSKT